MSKKSKPKPALKAGPIIQLPTDKKAEDVTLADLKKLNKDVPEAELRRARRALQQQGSGGGIRPTPARDSLLNKIGSICRSRAEAMEYGKAFCEERGVKVLPDLQTSALKKLLLGLQLEFDALEKPEPRVSTKKTVSKVQLLGDLGMNSPLACAIRVQAKRVGRAEAGRLLAVYGAASILKLTVSQAKQFLTVLKNIPDNALFPGTKLSMVPTDATREQIGGDHYKQFELQPAEICHRNKLTFLEGSVVKRMHRHSRGGKGIQDLKKAIHEIRLIAKFDYNEDI